MIKISKELLSEVLGVNIKVVFYEEKYILICGADIGKDHIYNIYELAHKCKVWANSKDYWVTSGYDNKYYCMLRDMPDNQWFYANTEVEAIFKACEWILNNKPL